MKIFNHKSIRRIGFLAAIFFCVGFMFSTAKAQVIAFELNGNTGDETTINSTTTDANLNTSTLSRGAGITASALGNSFSSTGFDGATLAAAITNNEYLQFNVTPKSGFKVSLSTLDVNFRRSGTGPNMFQFQYSLDGFATAGVNVGSTISFTSTTTNGVAQPQIDLSTIAALQNVAFPNTITFRLYAFGASATTGTFAIGRLAGNDLAIGGTTAAVITAAGAIIGGRITTAAGRGIRNVRLSLIGGSLTEPVYATSSAFGYYAFPEVPTGADYILTVNAKRYVFNPSTVIVNLNESVSNLDFVGEDIYFKSSVR